MTVFDKKFGPERLKDLTGVPGVYLFRDEQQKVIYIGKAKNIRRRLSAYRNATTKKRDRKLRDIVKAAHRLEIILQESDEAALLLENSLIIKYEPEYNVAGRFYHLYPAIGVGTYGGLLIIVLTAEASAWSNSGFRFFGVYKSRTRSTATFDALDSLLTMAGHREPSRLIPSPMYIRGTRIRAYRRIANLSTAITDYFASPSSTIPLSSLGPLVQQLLELKSARKRAKEVEAHLATLARFEAADIVPLNTVLRSARMDFALNSERDALFIRHQASIARQ